MVRPKPWSVEAVRQAYVPRYVRRPGEPEPFAYILGDPRFQRPPPKTRLGRVLRWMGF